MKSFCWRSAATCLAGKTNSLELYPDCFHRTDLAPSSKPAVISNGSNRCVRCDRMCLRSQPNDFPGNAVRISS
jgi:hypothetical protein